MRKKIPIFDRKEKKKDSIVLFCIRLYESKRPEPFVAEHTTGV